jgi:hypothetical protein
VGQDARRVLGFGARHQCTNPGDLVFSDMCNIANDGELEEWARSKGGFVLTLT